VSDDLKLADRLRCVAERPDEHGRLGLVVQGGGLRGVYSMAALAVLEEEGLRDAFTCIVGSSSGAINGAYFLAGQAREALGIYTEDLCNGGFVSLARFWKILDVDHLIDVTVKRDHALNVQAMDDARGTLLTVLTEADTGEARIVSSRDPRVDLHEALRATAACPGLYNRKVRVGAQRYVDGGIAGLVPVDIAFREGMSVALVLLTRNFGDRRDGAGPALRSLLRTLPIGQSRAIREKLFDEDQSLERVMDSLEAESGQRPRRTWTLLPSDRARLVGRVTNDAARLTDCAEMARADMQELLQHECPPFPPADPSMSQGARLGLR
jgi:predicted patatin/cPLA2 family phospholipase